MVGLKTNADLLPLFHIVVHCSELNKNNRMLYWSLHSFTCGT